MSEAVVHPNVRFAGEYEVGDFCVIGLPFRHMPDETVTEFGPGAVLRSHTVVYAGNRIGVGFQTGHGAFLRECNEIGDNVSIGTKTVVEHHVTIEDGVRIHSQAFVPEYCVLKAGCWIGPNVVLTNAKYPKSPGAKANLKGVVVGENAKLGANSTVLPGVVIGADSLVGAGSVVTADVPEGVVVVGNPACVVNRIENLPYRPSEE